MPEVTPALLRELQKPFPSRDIEWLVAATNKEKTKGLVFPYIRANAIQARLDEVLGAENWRDDFKEWLAGNLVGVCCILYIHVGQEWIGKSDGAGYTDTEPIKGGFSGAFKRAARKWGIGRYLDQVPGQWVAVETCGKSSKPEHEPMLPAEFLPPDDPGRGRRQPEPAGDEPSHQPATASGEPRRDPPKPAPSTSRRTDPPAPGGKALISPHQLRMIPELAKQLGMDMADIHTRVTALGAESLETMTAADAATLYMDLTKQVQAKKKGK